MKILISLFIASISLSLCLNIYSADNISIFTYKWVDEKGITQYTERPPENNAYEKITVNATGGKRVTKVSAEEAIDKAELKSETTPGTLDEAAVTYEQNCKIAKQNMTILKNVAKIRISDEKGEKRLLSPEEIQKQVIVTQKQIDINCKSTKAN
ncbi:MAG: DUF4124 domain-containing protein [Gammaproteobacteria bacterium]|nr:DUF4124 domain-containing protein [Gammaproteobacteria bacterium]